ncbi:MAG: polysaccharide biosynthesis C-terminal domain-containing protein, partial [Solirubrobacterales bacterium]
RMQSEGGLRENERKLLSSIALSIGLGISVIVVASSDAAVYLFGGSDYSEAVIPTIILGVSLVSTSYSYLVGTALIMAGRDRAYLIIMLVAVLANVSLNVLLIPSLGIDAAAAIAAGTEVLAVTAIAEVIGPAGGATRRTTFLGVLALAAAVGLVKYGLLEVSIWVNAAVSAIIIGAGVWLVWRAYAGLRTLPSHVEFDELSVLPT